MEGDGVGATSVSRERRQSAPALERLVLISNIKARNLLEGAQTNTLSDLAYFLGTRLD